MPKIQTKLNYVPIAVKYPAVLLSIPIGKYHRRRDVVDMHSGNYVEAKNISKVPNLRNYSICRYLEIKR